MKREAAPAVAGSVVMAGLLLHASVIELGQTLPGGPRAWAQAWGAWGLGGGEAQVVGDVVLAGWPVLATIAALDLVFPLAVATTGAVLLWLAAGLAGSYAAARSLGAEPLGAACVAAFAGANPAVLQGISEGRYEWLVVPWAALALASRGRPLAVAIGVLGASLHTPLLGAAVAGLAVMASGLERRAVWTALAAALPVGVVAALHWGVQSIPFAESVVQASGNAGDWLEPAFSWRDDATSPQLGLWLGLPLSVWAWRRGTLERGLALGGAAALVLSLGPELRWGALAFSFGGTTVPAPAAVLEAFVPLSVVTWKSVLVPGLVAGALALSRLDRRAAAILGVGALIHAAVNPIGAVDARERIAYPQLPGSGPVLHVPVGVEDGTRLRWLYAQTMHQRPLLTGMASPEPAAFLADPLSILAINAAEGSPKYAIPDQTATVVLQNLGVQVVVFERDALPLDGRVLMDQALGRYLGAPQRDLVGGVDVFALERTEGVPAEPTPLVEALAPPDGMLAPDAWLEAHPPGR